MGGSVTDRIPKSERKKEEGRRPKVRKTPCLNPSKPLLSDGGRNSSENFLTRNHSKSLHTTFVVFSFYYYCLTGERRGGETCAGAAAGGWLVVLRPSRPNIFSYHLVCEGSSIKIFTDDFRENQMTYLLFMLE